MFPGHNNCLELVGAQLNNAITTPQFSSPEDIFGERADVPELPRTLSQSFLTDPKAPPREALSEGCSFQQFGIPAGRADALLPEPAPEPEADPVPLPELPEAMPEVEEPVVVPDDDPLAWFLSRAMLVLTSQHWFEADVELDPVPVPCALASVARPKSAVPKAAARYNFFMDVSS